MNVTACPIWRRLLGAAMMVGLVAGAAVVGTAAPAQAVPGATVVSTPSASTSAAKSVVANCPPGTQVYGASGRIVNGGGSVLITDMEPSEFSVRVQGVESVAYAPSWQVIATAICAPDNGHNLHVDEWPSAANGSNVQPRSAFAPCPADEVMFGAGFRLDNANGNVYIAEVEPDSALTLLEVEARAATGFAPVFDLFAYVICGLPNGSVVDLVSETVAFGGAATQTAQTDACAPGATVTGVGGKITDNTDDVLFDRFGVNTLLSRATVTAWDTAMAGAAIDVTAYSICAT
jgi:hypothetical protein